MAKAVLEASLANQRVSEMHRQLEQYEDWSGCEISREDGRENSQDLVCRRRWENDHASSGNDWTMNRSASRIGKRKLSLLLTSEVAPGLIKSKSLRTSRKEGWRFRLTSSIEIEQDDLEKSTIPVAQNGLLSKDLSQDVRSGLIEGLVSIPTAEFDSPKEVAPMGAQLYVDFWVVAAGNGSSFRQVRA
ncbi:unnamed protein product [Linum trigynum]|uniref:Uncharacterized protein n=1 Tax=Linum trigynum TaxID=586398 RepID=A0AAV2FWP7_9ROSI